MSEERDPHAEARFKAAELHMLARSAALLGPSPAERFAALPATVRAEVLAELLPGERLQLLYAWRFWARPKQLAPCEPHRTWFLCGGRRSGKSRAAAERARERLELGARAIVLIGPTLTKIKRYMLGGVFRKDEHGSGLLDVLPPEESRYVLDHWNKNEGELHTSRGAVIYLHTAEDKNYRGGGVSWAWLDEPCELPPDRREELVGNIYLSLSLEDGLPAELCISSTPNPSRFFRELVADPGCITTFCTSDENEVNLEAGYIDSLERKFGKSRRGQQERGGRILGETEGALFSQAIIDDSRRAPGRLVALTVACDPAIRTNKRNDSTDVVAGGIDAADELYPLVHWSKRAKPNEWGMIIVLLAFALAPLSASPVVVVGEVNRGGDTVENTVAMMAKDLRRDARERKLLVPDLRRMLAGVTLPRGALSLDALLVALAESLAGPRFVETTAYRSKASRAEELSVEHECGRLHFPEEPLVELEDEITTWSPSVPGPSPNGLDALVWMAWHLRGGFRELVVEDRAGYGAAMRAAQTRLPTRAARERRII